jgi:hypothetical protein
MSARKTKGGGGGGGGSGSGSGKKKKKGGGGSGGLSTRRQPDFAKNKKKKAGRSMDEMRSKRGGGKSPGKRGKPNARDKVRERGGGGTRRGGGGGSGGRGGSGSGPRKVPKEPKKKKSGLTKFFSKLCGGPGSGPLDFTLEPHVRKDEFKVGFAPKRRWRMQTRTEHSLPQDFVCFVLFFILSPPL